MAIVLLCEDVRGKQNHQLTNSYVLINMDCLYHIAHSAKAQFQLACCIDITQEDVRVA